MADGVDVSVLFAGLQVSPRWPSSPAEGGPEGDGLALAHLDRLSRCPIDTVPARGAPSAEGADVAPRSFPPLRLAFVVTEEGPTAPKVRAIVLAAERLGLPGARLLEGTGIAPQTLLDPLARISIGAWARVWRRAVELTREPALGVLAARDLDPGYFGVVEYSACACATLGEALAVAVRYYPLANRYARMELLRTPGAVFVSRSVLGDELGDLPVQAGEFAIAALTRVLQRVVARPVALTSVRFRHPPPPSVAVHEAYFGCPVRFGAEHDALELPASALATPMATADPHLRTILEQHGDALLRDLADPESPLADRVRREVLRCLRAGPDIDAVARALGTSTRTLQRRLAEEGAAFREIVDELRMGLARRHLDAGLSPGEVSFLLGYSEVSAFHRAFRAATGSTPAEYSGAPTRSPAVRATGSRRTAPRGS